MLKQICMREDISHYCFDITRKWNTSPNIAITPH
jgi:hypothetical protein